MGMRIWHQSFTVLEDLPGYPEAIQAHAAKILRPDTEIVLNGQAPGTYPTNYPGNDIGYNYTYWFHGNQWIAAGRAAEAKGFDAYAMCTLPNPMLREARSLIDIPVIGMGETCCHLATMFDQRFAIMLFIDRMIPLYEEQIRQYGLTERCAGVVASGLQFGLERRTGGSGRKVLWGGSGEVLISALPVPKCVIPGLVPATKVSTVPRLVPGAGPRMT